MQVKTKTIVLESTLSKPTKGKRIAAQNIVGKKQSQFPCIEQELIRILVHLSCLHHQKSFV